MVRAHVALLGIVLFLSACKTPPDASKPAPASSHDAVSSGLEGEVTLGKDVPATKGRLVIGWRTAAEQQLVDKNEFSMQLVSDMVLRYEVAEEIDLAKTPRVRYRVKDPKAPRDGVAVAILDVGQQFWPTAFGSGPGLIGNSKAGGGEIALAPIPSRGASSDEPCAGPRRKMIAIAASGLSTTPRKIPSGGVGERRFCAWLPKSFGEKTTRRYPIIFLLPGLMSTEMAYLSGDKNLGTRFDAIAEKTGKEAVLVGVDTSSAFGSTYLEDSKAQGNYDSFLKDVAIPKIEKEVRGLGTRGGRALIGQSTGGYNTLSYGLRHSDLFAALGASAPDAPDFEVWMLDHNQKTRRAREWFTKLTFLEDTLGGPGQLMSYAEDWSPPGTTGNAKWPVDGKTGAINEAVMERWVAKTPHGLMRDAAFASRVKKDLSGRVLIIVGKNDEFGLHHPAQHFANELNGVGVETTFTATDHGHGNGVDRLEVAAGFVLEKLDPAK